MSDKTVAVLGASPKPDRYSNKAMKMLLEHGYSAIPVAPGHDVIEGRPAVKDLASIHTPIHTVTVYVGEKRSAGMTGDLLTLGPQRVVFNPGAENPALAERLKEAGIEVLEACTLVLLRTGQF